MSLIERLWCGAASQPPDDAFRGGQKQLVFSRAQFSLAPSFPGRGTPKGEQEVWPPTFSGTEAWGSTSAVHEGEAAYRFSAALRGAELTGRFWECGDPGLPDRWVRTVLMLVSVHGMGRALAVR